MTAVTAGIETLSRPGEIVAYPVAASTKIYKGTMVQLSSGYATSMTKAASLVFCGVALEDVDNSSGSAGDKVVRCARKGIHELALASAAITDVGSAVYALDNATVTKTSTDATEVGKAVKFENSGKIFIDIGGKC
ncbi:hypothetical protein MSSAC_2780 [Methanosarcina siciliae C2J]|uniref:Phage protein n=1 Tax=Methanosarcina siciliae C2J TaxID=1434118 RepID=A0A0E3PKD4_9EURY|nr:capsid cement protein [Methanosarcina siciliae]AKB35608.1 hypothetical protein MSSAC_1018 [Methanosarcina siciliae C2J]AKB37370.1 hypothetical protein MSSAC_2780 [Methanosarcina siciliae C2J]